MVSPREVLRRHVRELALEAAARSSSLFLLENLRDAEVRDARDAVDADEDVLRRDVAVHEADVTAALVDQLVRGVQAGERVERDAHRDARRQLAAALRGRDHELAEATRPRCSP